MTLTCVMRGRAVKILSSVCGNTGNKLTMIVGVCHDHDNVTHYLTSLLFLCFSSAFPPLIPPLCYNSFPLSFCSPDCSLLLPTYLER